MDQLPGTELDSADLKIWNEIWDGLYHTHYHAFYEELCAEHTIKFWKTFDTAVRGLQLVTAGGSAISGWTLWQQPSFRWIWIGLAGLAALTLIVHGMLNISDKIKEDTLIYSKFKHIRLKCATLKGHMRIKTYERLSDYKREYIDLVKEHDAASASKIPDFLLRKKTEVAIQSKLNHMIKTNEQ